MTKRVECKECGRMGELVKNRHDFSSSEKFETYYDDRIIVCAVSAGAVVHRE